MSEMSPESPSAWHSELVDKPLEDMTYQEYAAWYLEYMGSVPEENTMFISGMPLEIEDDPEAFKAFVIAFQQLKRQGMV